MTDSGQLISYSDLEIWAKSIVSIVLKNIGLGRKVFAVGESSLAKNVKLQLANFDISLLPVNQYSEGIVILFDKLEKAVFEIMALQDGALIIDAVLGSVKEELMTLLAEKKISILRPQMHPYILAEIDAQLGTNMKHVTIKGVGTVNDIRIASGGWVASKGTVIVDNVNRPRKIFGIANGQGFLLGDQELDAHDRERIQKLEILLAQQFSND
jgi:hypothetical protein